MTCAKLGLLLLLVVGAAAFASHHRAPHSRMANRIAAVEEAEAVDCRRGFLGRTFLVGAAGLGLTLGSGAESAHAVGLTAEGKLTKCPDGAQNCRSSEGGGTLPPIGPWVSGKSSEAALKDVLDVVQGYPKTGQNGIDGRGWQIAEQQAGSNYLRVEYTSKIFKFVDDLEFKVGSDGTVSVRSSSRVGESDLGVNTKRVEYFEAALKEKGWKI